MGYLRNILIRSVTGLCLLHLNGQYLHAQVNVGLEEIMETFRYDLGQARLQRTDTLEVYSQYLKRLVDRGNYLHADTIFVQVAPGMQALQDSSQFVEIIKTRAYMYKVQRRFGKSLEDYLWLKAYMETKDDKQGLMESYSLIAEYYRAVGNYDLCNVHLKLAESLFQDTNPTDENFAFWYSRKAAWSNEYLKNQDSVEYYASQGLRIAERTDNIQTQALLLNELGYSNMSRNRAEEVILGYFDEAKNLLFENQRFRDYIDVANNIASYYYARGDFEKSIRIIEEILPVQEENRWYDPMQISLETACGIYQYNGEKEKFDESLHNLYQARLENLKTYNAITVNDLALTYEKNLAEKELQVQEQKTAVAQEEAQSNQRAFIIALIIAIALLLIAIITFQVNRRFKKKNELLNRQRDQIQKTNSELEKSLEKQKLLFKELNHRVKNNLSILTGLIYLQEVGEDDDHQKTLGTLRNRIKSMALAHESLYNAEEAEKIEFQGYLGELFLELRSALSDADKIETRLECTGFELGLQQAVPLAMIINELFTNSVKHGFKKVDGGIITVKAHHEQDHSIVEYTDNGIGFSPDQREKKTLGLRLVKLLLEQLDATLDDKSGISGVHFKLTIPVTQS